MAMTGPVGIHRVRPEAPFVVNISVECLKNYFEEEDVPGLTSSGEVNLSVLTPGDARSSFLEQAAHRIHRVAVLHLCDPKICEAFIKALQKKMLDSSSVVIISDILSPQGELSRSNLSDEETPVFLRILQDIHQEPLQFVRGEPPWFNLGFLEYLTGKVPIELRESLAKVMLCSPKNTEVFLKIVAEVDGAHVGESSEVIVKALASRVRILDVPSFSGELLIRELFNIPRVLEVATNYKDARRRERESLPRSASAEGAGAAAAGESPGSPCVLYKPSAKHPGEEWVPPLVGEAEGAAASGAAKPMDKSSFTRL